MEAGGRISSNVNFWRTASTSLAGRGFRGLAGVVPNSMTGPIPRAAERDSRA
jgi:hypothetical protein